MTASKTRWRSGSSAEPTTDVEAAVAEEVCVKTGMAAAESSAVRLLKVRCAEELPSALPAEKFFGFRNSRANVAASSGAASPKTTCSAESISALVAAEVCQLTGR